MRLLMFGLGGNSELFILGFVFPLLIFDFMRNIIFSNEKIAHLTHFDAIGGNS